MTQLMCFFPYFSATRSVQVRSQKVDIHPIPTAALIGVLAVLAYVAPVAILFIGIIVTLILLHEGGHFAVARKTGMRPTEFFAGFGPEVFGYTRNGVRYGLKAILMGGYVKIPGMTKREEIAPELEAYSYRAATRPRRLAVILAGCSVNLLLAVFLFGIAHGVVGTPVTNNEGVVVDHNRAGLVDSARAGVHGTSETTKSTLEGLGSVFTNIGGYSEMVAETRPGGDNATANAPTGEAPTRFMSPLGITRVFGQAVDVDLFYVVGLAAILSTALGVFNLLPLVPLDGGHAMVVIAEGAASKLRRRNVIFDSARLAPLALGVLLFFGALSLSSLWLDVNAPSANPFG